MCTRPSLREHEGETSKGLAPRGRPGTEAKQSLYQSSLSAAIYIYIYIYFKYNMKMYSKK